MSASSERSFAPNGKQARSNATRDLLMDALEVLAWDWQVDSISSRDVGREAGQRNNSVVQYHFGGGGLAPLVTDALARKWSLIDQPNRELLIKSLATDPRFVWLVANCLRSVHHRDAVMDLMPATTVRTPLQIATMVGVAADALRFYGDHTPELLARHLDSVTLGL